MKRSFYKAFVDLPRGKGKKVWGGCCSFAFALAVHLLRAINLSVFLAWTIKCHERSLNGVFRVISAGQGYFGASFLIWEDDHD